MAQFPDSLPGKDRPDPDRPVWRYMSFTKFVSLLTNRAVFMARADTFEDLFEGAIFPKAFDNQLEQLDPSFEMSARALQAPRDRDREHESVQNFVAVGPSGTYVSCWYAGSSECDAMWKVYGESRESVAIRSTVGRLANAMPRDVFLVPIQYRALNELTLPDTHRVWQFAYKRVPYAFESELRCIKFDFYDNRPKSGHSVPVNVTDLVERVVVSPRAPRWFADTVAKTVAQLGFQLKVDESEMGGPSPSGA